MFNFFWSKFYLLGSGTLRRYGFIVSHPSGYIYFASSLVTLGTITNDNASTKPYVAYCWHSVEGYSKVGTYTGNGNLDGTFVYTGFRPALLFLKVNDAADHWEILDDKRFGYNVTKNALEPNLTVVETDDGTRDVDLLSNGFKWRSNYYAATNGDGNDYMYLAIAKGAFKYSNAR